MCLPKVHGLETSPNSSSDGIWRWGLWAVGNTRWGGGYNDEVTKRKEALGHDCRYYVTVQPETLPREDASTALSQVNLNA